MFVDSELKNKLKLIIGSISSSWFDKRSPQTYKGDLYNYQKILKMSALQRLLQFWFYVHIPLGVNYRVLKFSGKRKGFVNQQFSKEAFFFYNLHHETKWRSIKEKKTKNREKNPMSQLWVATDFLSFFNTC
jgi:hypothetical protein